MEIDQCILSLKFTKGLLNQNREELYEDTFAGYQNYVIQD